MPATRRALAFTPFLVAYLWGLAFGNHLTILWFAPLVIFVVGRGIGRAAHPARTALFCLGLFLLGTSINLYLPLRSSCAAAARLG